MNSTEHMNFRHYGRSYHLKINTSKDLQRAVELDEAHWVAVSSPISTVNCDGEFLSLLDTDKNGRIRCQELKNAIRWILKVLSDHSGITEARGTLRLKEINLADPDGQQIHDAALKILKKLGRRETEQISLDEVRRIRQQVESMPVSEAGIILPEAAEKSEIATFIADVVATIGGIGHPSGVQGINQAKLDEFLSKAKAFLLWHEQGKIPDGQIKTDIMPLGNGTSAAYAVLVELQDKIDQYFAQCKALALEERLGQRMGITEAELQELDLDDPAVIEEVLKQGSLAKPKASGELNFEDQINPAYAKTLERFRHEVIGQVLGESENKMTPEQWQQIKNFFGAHQKWVQAKPSPELEGLGVQKLQGYLDERFNKAVRELIAKSTETAFVLDNIRLTEQLLLYQRYMIELANNFVSFPHLYDPDSRAVFEMGSLVMDGRRFNLTVKAVNRAEHSKIAKASNMYVLYVEIVPKDTDQKYEVAVPVTWGTKGNLCVGKRGVFYDIGGNEADAKVVQIIENPISLGEALLNPFQRLGKMLTGKIESITAQADKKFDSQAATVMNRTTTATPAAGGTGGMLLGGGLAIAALGSALAYITKTLADTSWLAILVGVLVAVLLVMIPISLVAFIKLRKRNLSAILEGSGWAINARMRLTRKQGKGFTDRPSYPKGSKGVHPMRWGLLAAVVAVLAVLLAGGYLAKWCLSKRDQQSVTKPVDKQTSPSETGQNKELPGI
ncbi:MAG: hypothetical protein GWP14_03635 [Actinobacteria bacterium]|nr:hypothetical protein [Actinomycetota bacterium]